MPIAFLGSLRTDNYHGRPAAFSRASTSLPLPTALLQREVVGDSMTLIEQRLLLALLYLGWEALPFPRQAVEVAGAEIREAIGHCGAESNAALRAGFERLAARTLRIADPLDPRFPIESPVLTAWSYCRQAAGFRWIIGDAVADWCAESFTYARLDLSIVAALRLPTAIRLYEVCCALAPRVHAMKTIEIDEFRSLFDCGAKYAKFSEFDSRVVKPAVNEVNAKSPYSLTCTWSSSRRGRRKPDRVQLSVQAKASPVVPPRIQTRPMQPSEFLQATQCACCLPIPASGDR